MIVHHIEKTVHERFDGGGDAALIVSITFGENFDRPVRAITIEGLADIMLQPTQIRLFVENGADGDVGILAEALRWIADQIDVR